MCVQVLVRKWRPLDEPQSDVPHWYEDKQPYEGQLSINAMRSAAAICQSGCVALIRCKDASNRFHHVWGAMKVRRRGGRVRDGIATADAVGRRPLADVRRDPGSTISFNRYPDGCAPPALRFESGRLRQRQRRSTAVC